MPGSRGKYANLDDKLRLVQTILDERWIDLDERWKLQALGVAFGDAVAQELLLHWVWVTDENGSDPALNWPGTTLLCYAQTMIAKRVEDGEEVDVADLFSATCERLRTLAFSGDYV